VRYLIQFVIPVVIFLVVVYAVTRTRRQPNGESDSGASVFLAIVVIGAVAAVAALFVLQVNWNAL